MSKPNNNRQEPPFTCKISVRCQTFRSIRISAYCYSSRRHFVQETGRYFGLVLDGLGSDSGTRRSVRNGVYPPPSCRSITGCHGCFANDGPREVWKMRLPMAHLVATQSAQVRLIVVSVRATIRQRRVPLLSATILEPNLDLLPKVKPWLDQAAKTYSPLIHSKLQCKLRPLLEAHGL